MRVRLPHQETTKTHTTTRGKGGAGNSSSSASAGDDSFDEDRYDDEYRGYGRRPSSNANSRYRDDVQDVWRERRRRPIDQDLSDRTNSMRRKRVRFDYDDNDDGYGDYDYDGGYDVGAGVAARGGGGTRRRNPKDVGEFRRGKNRRLDREEYGGDYDSFIDNYHGGDDRSSFSSSIGGIADSFLPASRPDSSRSRRAKRPASDFTMDGGGYRTSFATRVGRPDATLDGRTKNEEFSVGNMLYNMAAVHRISKNNPLITIMTLTYLMARSDSVNTWLTMMDCDVLAPCNIIVWRPAAEFLMDSFVYMKGGWQTGANLIGRSNIQIGTDVLTKVIDVHLTLWMKAFVRNEKGVIVLHNVKTRGIAGGVDLSWITSPEDLDLGAARRRGIMSDMVKQEGATMAQQAMLHGIPYMKVRGVVNSYALPEQNCATNIFFSCWQNNANKVATTTIAMINAMFNDN
jgi:hypothetical protein